MRNKGNPLGTLDEIEAWILYRLRLMEPIDAFDYRKLQRNELVHLWTESTNAFRQGRAIPTYCSLLLGEVMAACVADPGSIVPLLGAPRGRGRPKKAEAAARPADPAWFVRVNRAVTLIEDASGTGQELDELAEKFVSDPELRARWLRDLRGQDQAEGTAANTGKGRRGQGSARERMLEKQAAELGMSTRTLERIVRARRQKIQN